MVAAGMSATAGRASTGSAGANAGDVAVGGSGESANAGGSGASAAAAAGNAAPAMACDPSMKGEPPMTVMYKETDSPLFGLADAATDDTPNTGDHKVTIEVEPTLSAYTIYRPEFKGKPLPIVAWAEGGCLKDGTFFGGFLMELASHGFLIIADGPPNGTDSGMEEMDDPGPQTKAIDWAIAENERPCSQYYQKLDTSKVAVMGQSCGGLMSIVAGGDPRVTTTVMWNSGLFDRDPMTYMKLHSPIAYFDGGPDDIAYENGEADYEAIDNVPILFANDTRGHGGTYWQDNGGASAQVGVQWLNWQLYDDVSPTAKGMFVGADCGLCKSSDWTIASKMLQ